MHDSHTVLDTRYILQPCLIIIVAVDNGSNRNTQLNRFLAHADTGTPPVMYKLSMYKRVLGCCHVVF